MYDGPDGVISSKRWEAYRAGIEDYELCRMLRATIVTAKKAGKVQAAKIMSSQRALDRLVDKVLKRRDDPMVAERAHQELLRQVRVLTGK